MSEPRASTSLTDTFSGCATIDICVWTLVTRACTEMGVQAGTFFELDAAGKSLKVANTHGILPWRLAQGTFPITQGICGWVTQQRQSAIVNDVSKDARFNQQVDLITQFKTVSVLCMPVMYKDRLYGVLELINRKLQPFMPEDFGRLHPLIDAAAARLHALSA